MAECSGASTGIRTPETAEIIGRIRADYIHLLPTLPGDGIRLFGHPGAAPVDLETTSVTRAGQITNLRFRLLK